MIIPQLDWIFEAVTCTSCRERLAGFWPDRGSNHYDVGNISKPEMGHQMYHSHEGRIALCIADKRGTKGETQ